MNCKSTEKKTKNFKKNENNKKNILNIPEIKADPTKYRHNKDLRRKSTYTFITNESMKFIINDEVSTGKSSNN